MPEHVVSKIVSQKYKELAVRVQKAPKYCAMAQMQNIMSEMLYAKCWTIVFKYRDFVPKHAQNIDFMMLKQHA